MNTKNIKKYLPLTAVAGVALWLINRGKTVNGVGVLMSKPVFKEHQLYVIQRTNPMRDNIHTGVRTINDIKTYPEAVEDDYNNGYRDGWTPDYTMDDAKAVFKNLGMIRVYSSKPITYGVFVTPSKMVAQDYAGGGLVYDKLVDMYDVAWIDGQEGIYTGSAKLIY